MIYRCDSTSFRSSNTNFFSNIFPRWKLQVISLRFSKGVIKIHL